MKLLCSLLGHKLEKAPRGGLRYLKVHSPFARDGLGAEHSEVSSVCARCEERYPVGRIHLPERMQEKWLRQRLERLQRETHNAKEPMND